MIGNNLKSLKFIGIRDMNMDANLEFYFNEYEDSVKLYPYFNDAKELLMNSSES